MPDAKDDTSSRTKQCSYDIDGSIPLPPMYSKLRVKPKEHPYRFCTHCKQIGHEVKSCFLLHGYPKWWLDRSKALEHGSRCGCDRQCTTTSTGGRGSAPQANTIFTANTSTKQALGDIDRADLLGLTEEQWRLLQSLFHGESSSSSMTDKHFGIRCIIDTGASNHMTGDLSLLDEVHEVHSRVALPNGTHVEATKAGTAVLASNFRLNNVLYVPNFTCHLLSVSQLLRENNYTIQFTKTLCVIQNRTSRMLIGTGEQKGGLYYYFGSVSASQVSCTGSFDLWHKRMGHPSSQVLEKVIPVNSNSMNPSLKEVCEVCIRAKHSRTKFSISENKAENCFDLVHCDLWGPYREPASCGAYYFLTIVDDYSRAVWIYLLINKSGVSSTFLQFFAMIKRQFDAVIKVVRSDNGTEFKPLQPFFKEQGIVYETSCVGTPQQNGRVERKHQHILNVARALMFQGNLPIKFWGERILTAGYLINRTPTPVLKNKTPYDFLYKAPPPYDHLRVFGCLCFAYNQNRKGDKFASRSRKCLFLGYPHGKKGWQLFDLESEEFFVSRDVIFSELQFPYIKATTDAEPLVSDVDKHDSPNNDHSSISSAYINIAISFLY